MGRRTEDAIPGLCLPITATPRWTRQLRLLLRAGRPQTLLVLAATSLAGAALSPNFLSPSFPETFLAQTTLFQTLTSWGPTHYVPILWSLAHALGAAAITGLLWLGTAWLNDFFDTAIDAVSNRGRPLPAGVLSADQVLLWAVSAFALAVLLVSVEGDSTSLLMVMGAIALGTAYSAPPFRLRRSGSLASAAIGVAVSGAFLGGQVGQFFLTGQGVVAALLLGGLAAGVSSIKDFKDIEGDAPAGVRTLPVALGYERAVRINQALVAVAYSMAALPFAFTGRWLPVLAIISLGCLNGWTLQRLLLDRGADARRRAEALSMIWFLGVVIAYVAL